jgi:5-methyltetrahydropteroyltriglutamate--homocysteine methyltransferase
MVQGTRLAEDALGDPGRIRVNPDCGLRTRSWEVCLAKLTNMVEGARMAEQELNGG